MSQLGVRDFFMAGFENLQVALYQLTKLMEEYLPDLAWYLAELGIETHMFASQWFLTLFASKVLSSLRRERDSPVPCRPAYLVNYFVHFV